MRQSTPGAEPEITETTTDRDMTIGFLAMLRQCYSPEEDASFKRAHKLISREVHNAGGAKPPSRPGNERMVPCAGHIWII